MPKANKGYQGNKNAAKDGYQAKFRVRVRNKSDLDDIRELSTYQRGIAMIGYLHWYESGEADEMSFVDWIKKQCHAEGLEWGDSADSAKDE